MSQHDFKLSKPPIIEWWIRATFVPSDDGEPWNWSSCVDFLDQYSDSLTQFDGLPNLIPQAEPIRDPKSKHYIFEVSAEPMYFRRRTDDRSKSVQVGERELIVSHLRRESETYPGFSELYDEFRSVLNDYNKCFNPPAIDTLELHNVDLVVVPDRADGPFELTQFLIGAPILPPKPFGIAFDTDWSIAFKCPQPDDFANMQFSMLPPDGNDVRFRLDWHYWCHKIGKDTPDSVAQRLGIAHNYLNECFQAIFEEEVWKLFEPQ